VAEQKTREQIIIDWLLGLRWPISREDFEELQKAAREVQDES